MSDSNLATREATLCRNCAGTLSARMGAGWFSEPLGHEADEACDNCGRELGRELFHVDPEAHRSG